MIYPSVSLGGLMFPGFAISGWATQGLDGWFDLTDSKTDLTERPQAHGAFDPGFDWRQSGVYELTLAYFGDSHAETVAAVRELTGLADRSDALIPMSVTDDSGTTNRLVSIRHITVPDLHGDDELVAGIVVDLQAPDPLAYGVRSSVSTGLPESGGGIVFPVAFPADFGVASSDGRVRFTNSGTAPTPLIFKVSGGMSQGFSLRCVETGDVLTLRRPLAVDDYVLLDSTDGSVLLNGASPISGFLVEDDWWQASPGQTCTVQFTSLGEIRGTPMLELSAAPAFF